MTIVEVLRELARKQLMISAVDGRLVLNGNLATIDGTLLSHLHNNKAALLKFLTRGQYQSEYSRNCEVITPEMLPLVTLTAAEIETVATTVTGGVGNIQDIYPLAPLQEGILFHHLMAERGDPYLLEMVLGFDNRTRIDKYIKALQAVINRHDILRTAVLWEGLSEPVQVVHRNATLQVEEVALSPLSGDIAEQLHAHFSPRQFRIDIRQAPLLRVAIAYDKPNDRWLLMLLLHHLAGDHTTLDVMQQEIGAHLSGLQSTLPEPLPFRNLVAQARLGVSQEEHEAFFRNMLADVDEPTAPFGLLDVQGDGSGIEQARLTLDPALAQRLRANARRLEVSVASLCHLAWARVLSKISGRADVVFGTVLFGRMHGGAGADRIMGLFINTLPLRISINKNGVKASVQKTHTLLTDLLHHEHASLTLAQRCSSVPAPTPLFSSLFNYRHSPQATAISNNATIQAWQGISSIRSEERTNYPITVSVNDLGNGFSLDAQSSASIHPMRICEYMRTTLTSLVEALEVDPDKSLHTLDVLPAAERQQILYEWNATDTVFPKDKCVHQLFEQQVDQTPDAVAVVYEDQQLSYRELNLRANQLAHHLRDLGVKPDDRVAICVERSFEMIIGLLAVLKAGGAYVPLDPSYPIDRLNFMLQDTAPVALLTQSHLRLFANTDVSAFPVLDLSAGDLPWKFSPITNPDLHSIGLSPHHLAYVIYTSGSTGLPKGVMVQHLGLTNYARGAAAFLHCKQCNSIMSSTISFDLAYTSLYPPLICGGVITLLPLSVEYGIEAFAKEIDSGLHDLLKLTPSHLQALKGFAKGNVDLRVVTVIGGEALSLDLVNKWLALYPRSVVINHYGPTEATIGVAIYRVPRPSLSATVPIGKPIANTRIYILDVYGEPVPIGVTGELYIGGAGVARGYLNRPELTAEKFLLDPFVMEPGARMYRTGDLGRWLVDGNIEFVGRNDLQVKIRGFRIELGEIETSLSDYDGIRNAVVIVREDTTGDKRLVAYYSSVAPGTAIGAEQLRSHLLARLPEYMVPAAYVHLEAMPLTPNGKLDRKALPAPEHDAYATHGYEPPRGDTEQRLAAIWAEVLKLDRIGRHDNFFSLGGHSLLAVQVTSRLRQGFRVEVAVRDLFIHTALADLATFIESATRMDLPSSIVPCARSGRLPLSFAQQRLWFLAQMQGISEAYHISFGLRVHGSLNHAVLRRALDRILARHEALRTTFVFVGEEPVQQIAAAESDHFILIEQDLSHHEDPVVELQRIITLEASSSFDLEHGPLIRGRLVRLSKDEHALLLTMHHIVSDGWSMSILIDELSMLYSAFLRGEADPLPELEIQYADYAIWQRQWIEGDILQQQSAYWKTTLAGAPQLLDLPTDHPRPAEQQFAGAFAELVLNKALSAQLKALSKKYEATLYMTMLTGWALLLAKLSGQQDIVIGSPTANRGRLEVEKLIGFFVNTLTLRLDLSGSPSVGELLARVRMQALAAQQHQDIPFEQVVELAQPVRSLSYNPLFQVLFAWQNAATGSLELPGLQLSSLPSSSQRVSKFDLTLSLREADDTIVGGIEYATSLFEPATIRRYLDYFRILLEAMVSDETQTIDHISILPAAERQQILYEWNATDTVFPKDKCVHQLFEQQVDQTPDAVAVVYEDQQLSYRELNLRANQLAHHLRDLGVKPDDRVAICVERSFEMIIGLLAVLKAGGAYVPLDPSYPIDRLNFMLQDTAPVALLTQSHLQLFANTDVSAFPILDLSAGDLPWKFSPITNPDLHSIGLSPHHLAYVIYTSGSTGLPKGVMVQHANIVRLFTATDHWFHFDADDVWSFSHSFAFDFSTWEIWGALLYGARLLVVSKDNVLSPAEFYHVLCQHNVTILSQTPSAFRQLIAAQSHSSELNQLRYVVLGGEALELTSLMPWYRQNQRRQPNLVNMYGITETTVHVTYCPLEQSDAEMTGRLPIGSRLPDLRIYILDVYGEPVPIGVTGELYIGGAGVARGYLNRPELTAEKFLLDPFVMEPGARMYRTGDLGRWLVDGNIEFVGRNDLQVKIRGFRIELGEIETSLSDYDGIRNAVVIVREDTTGDKRLVAYYSSIAPGTAIGAEQLRSHLLARLPEYMVPAAYVYLEAMPLTPNGKLDRKALPAPEHDAYATHGYEPPRGDTEQRLAAIWADVLKLEHIGRHDNFFSLGGHSLLAITVIERMRRIGFNLDVRSIFIAPTLAELAGTLTDASVIVVPPLGIPFNCEVITPEMLPLVTLTAAEIETVATTVTGGVGNIQDIYPLAPLQEGILFHHLMAERGDPYLLEMVLGFDNRTRIDKYINALQAVINRHDILRTAVLWEGLSEPVQVVHRNATLQVEEVALSPLSGDIAEQLHAHFSPRQFRIDIRQAPLLRVAIAYDKPNDRWLLMLLLHHLAGDHTTLDVMQQEIGAHLSGLQSTLPEPLPFRNLVAQARLGVSQEEHEAFFRNMLADVDEPTAPFGLLDVQGDGSGIEQARLTLDPALAQRLRANARRLEVSVASLCHLAWARVLSKISGRADVVFGTVLFGRMHGGAGADRIMGLFINTLPLRISINKNGVRASVQKTHTLLTDLLHHEHASLTLAQRCSSVPAPTPLFSSLFNYRHSPQATAISNNATIQAWQGISSIRSEERTNYPITVSVNDLGNGFSLDAQSPASIHPMRICEYMRTTLTSLVEALEVDPDKSLHTLDVLPAAERQQILYEWNATDTAFPKDKCVHQLFEQQVDQTPDAVAVVYEDQQLSYRELNLRANQLAHHLRDLGVKPDDRVAICVERSFEMIIGLLAVLKAGGAYVPLDPSYPIDRLNFMLQDTAPVALLTQSHLRLFANTDVSAFPILDLSAGDLPWKFSPITNPDLHSIGLSPHHLAYVIYTSGSTGLPKGVMVQHLGLMNYLSWALTQYAVTNDSVVSSALAFDATITTLYIPLLCGSRALLLPEEEGAETLLTQFKANQYSNLFKLTPTHLDIIGKRLRDENSRFCTNQVVIGGESLLPSTVNLWHDIQPDTSLINEYGPTECVVGCMVYVIPADATLLEHIPIGKPIANTRIYILDVYGEPVPIGVTGELYIGGAGVARGYLNRPELTAEKFLLDPFVMEPGARMYRTGDLGRWLVDGNIEFVGRNDLQVKIRGFRIELGEIETSLSDYDGIRNAVVIVREDTTGDKRLVAYYSSIAPSTAIGAEQLRAYLLARLPEYMVPAAYVHLEAMPLTPNGKLDRKALPAPEHDAYATHGYEPPRGDTEQRLAAIWAEVLKLDRIGRHDNFFSLGGHSLLAVQVTSRLRQGFRVEVAVRDLFIHTALADLATFIESATRMDLPSSIVPCARSGRLPLSFAQQRLWFLAQMQGISEAYHISFGLRVRGSLNHAVLRRALDRILARHEALRTTFVFVGEEPVQQIAAAESDHFILIEQDLSHHEDPVVELQRIITLEASSSFDLEHGPLIRGRLVRLSKDEHALLLTMHHIVSDGWSMSILIDELSMLYSAFLRGEADPLPELEIQYADYAIWQRQWIEGDILQQQSAYWKTTLAGAPQLLDLPTDHPRPAEQQFAGAFAELVLNKALSAQLKALSKKYEATLYMTMLTGWALLLAKLSGQQDIVIGSPTANRGRLEVEKLIGFFVNTLTLRLDLSGSPSVGELLARVRMQALAAQQHQDIPFEQVVELAQPVRSLSYNPLFQVLFAWQNAATGSLELPGLQLSSLPSSSQRVSKFDLTLSLREADDTIVGGIEYATSLFEPATIRRYLDYFRILLEAMVSDETQTIDHISILPAAERQQILYEWNATDTVFPKDKCVHQLFEQQVDQTPDAVAVVYEDQQLSYRELNLRANQLAHHLRDLGVKPDDRVAICVERSFEMIIGLLAVLKAGGAYVPLDPSYPIDRLNFMLQDTAPVALLTQSHLQLFANTDVSAFPVLDLSAGDLPWKFSPTTNPDLHSIGLSPHHLAYVIYTSGSTGLPKGVMVQHANIVRLFTATDHWFHFDADDVWSFSHSFAFDFSTWEIWGALLYGARLLVVSKDNVLSPAEFYHVLCQHNVTILSQTPSAFRQLIAAQSHSSELNQLRYVVLGGEALELTSLMPWYRQNQRRQPNLVNMYGITETTVHVTYCPLEQSDAEMTGRLPIGSRLPDLRIYILDVYGEPVPIGVTGELYIGGAGVARGYLNRPELTAEKFLLDPFVMEPGARMYRTGDLGRWLVDGNIEFVGRNDLQVKIRGFRIELGEIETSLSDYDGIRNAVVIVREDTTGDKRLVAYYSSIAPGTAIGAEQLRSHLLARLPEYMVPAAYVYLEAMPLTPNGKLDRKALPAPERDAYATHGYEPPRGDTEQRLAAIWADVLKLEHIGRHDNFFSLGGHSLLAITVIERMRRIGFNLDVRSIFIAPTLAELACTLTDASVIVVPPLGIPFNCEVITPEMLPLVTLTAAEIETVATTVTGGVGNIQDIYPLAPLQEGILFHHLMAERGDPYLLEMVLGFDNRTRIDKYIKALQAVINRHDILRTAVLWEGLSEPVQVVHRNATLQVEEVALSPLSGDIAEQLHAHFSPRQFRIDIRQAPLLRVAIAYDKPNDRWLLMLLLHHLAGDHTTLDVMQQEIGAHLSGLQSTLPEPLPFRNLVAQARLGVSQEEHEAFFRNMLADVDEPTAPFGLLDVQGDGSGIEQARLTLDPALAQRLRANARRLEVSVASLCHLAWARVLSKISGRADVVFGTVLFGRMHGGAGADRIMGLFINTLPLRISINKNGVRASVQKTHTLLTDLLHHEHASLTLAQRCSSVPAPTPLFSSLFNYRHSPQATAISNNATIQAWQGISSIRSEERTNYPITVSVNDLGNGFSLDAQSPASIHPMRICEYMRTTLTSLVEALEVDPDKSLHTLDVLPAAERQQILYEWNATDTVFPKDKCVHQLFEQQVDQTPDAVAVVYEDQQLSYRELNLRANQLAHHLRDLGVKPDDRVAICVERSFEMIIGLLAVLKAGGAYVPLDPFYPIDRLNFMLQDTAPVALLTQSHLQLFANTDVSAFPVLDLSAGDLPWKFSPITNPDLHSIGLSPHHLAYVIYTSGSTGLPKGVMVQHLGLTNLVVVQICDFGITKDSRVLQFASISFDASVSEVSMALCSGATLYLLHQESFRGDAAIKACASYEITHVTCPPALLARISDHALLNNVNVLILAGESLNASLAHQWSHSHLVINAYGPTEATIGVAIYRVPRLSLSATIPIGKPIANTRIYILDVYGEPVPIGVTGELYIGGAGVARGYLNRPELTAEKFLLDPFVMEPGARMYRTGDLGRWLVDGNIEFVGRNDLQVKIRGFRIELGEIETSLSDYDGIRNAVVIVREDTTGDKRLVAYYSSVAPGTAIGAEQLRAYLLARLPEYMVPAAYVYLEAMPLTPNGKLDRKALPAPEHDAYATHGYEPPRGDTEQRLAAIWAEVLDLEHIGRHDSFFELGGHSLLAVQVTSRLRQGFSVEVAVRDLFIHTALADLATFIESATRMDLPSSIVPCARSGRLPLSFAQQRLWFLAQMQGISEAYHISFGLRVRGSLNHAVLSRALDRILARHEALRTTFVFVGEEPVQQIAAAESNHFILIEQDLSHHEDPVVELQRIITLEASSSFDLEHGPLIRGRLVRLSKNEHALLLTMHHIVSDGWSMSILIDELSMLYSAFLRGEADPLPELEIQYADYAIWQRQWIEGDILQQQSAYWKTTLAGAPQLLDLPTDHPRPAEQQFAGAFAELVLNKALSAQLKALSKKYEATLYMTMLTGWALLLAKLSGQQDIVIGSPTANRGRLEVEKLIGFFVNTLTLRLDLSGSPSVGELLARVRMQALAAQQHQDIPFEQVVELAQPVRSLSYNPLFQVLFAWQNAATGSLELPGLQLSSLPSSSQRVSKFDLTLSLREADDTIVGGIEYATSLFEPATIRRYLDYFRILLEAMVSDETQTIDHISILPAAERQQILYEWNATDTVFPKDKCVHQLFEQQVDQTPDAVAVVYEDQQLSYRELNLRANQLAHHLRDLGVKPDDRVAICVERSFEMIIGLLAVLKAGGAYVPLDPSYPIDRLNFMLQDTAPVALLTQSHLQLFANTDVSAFPVLDLSAGDLPWKFSPTTNPDLHSIGLSPHHLAYVIYTSGSTGLPKGVMVQHLGLMNYLSWALTQYAVTNDSVVSSALAFDATITTLYIPLLCGSRALLLPEEEGVETLLTQFKANQYSNLFKLTPTHLDIIGERLRDKNNRFCTNQVVIGGESLLPSTVNLWHDIQPDTSLINEYGPTECVVGCMVYVIPADATLLEHIPIGKPIANTRIYILDVYGEPVPIGVTGELYIGGAGVARGYLNRPELTAEKFLLDPFVMEPGARMYRTGDLGRWLVDGNIEFVGRNDLQVKIRGFRIELGEIETSLSDYDGIRNAVVIVREDTTGDKRLVAYYSSVAPGTAIGAEQLRAYLLARLPEYMVPAAYVYLEAMPLTPNGKLDRKALPAPEHDAYATHGYEPPRGDTEQRLAAIWADVLKLEHIGRHDNFFSLGGHSLLAITVIERMRRIGFNLDVRSIFIAPTLAELAGTLTDASVIVVPPLGIPFNCEVITPEMLPLVTLTAAEIETVATTVTGGVGNIQDIYPLAPLQEGILFHHLMAERGDPYLLEMVLGFDNRTRIDKYIKALQAVINRHDILRTAVLWEGLSEPVQVVHRNATLQVEEVALSPLSGDIAEQLHAHFSPRQFRIDIRQAPLLRVAIAYDKPNDRWLLMLLLHHLAGDHTTLDVMQQEIGAHLSGLQSTLPEPLPFRNLVAQARLGVSQEEHEAFFRNMLADVDEPTAPFGLLDVQGDGSGIEQARLTLDPALAQRLRANARRLEVSVASLCHLAWARVLSKISGRADVVFGTVLFGRMHGGAGADRIMGLFINTLPLRISINKNGVKASVQKTHTLLTDLLHHEHASLTLAQRCSSVPAPTPLFSSLFNYRHSPQATAISNNATIQAWQGISSIRSEERTNYPITVSVNDLGNGFSLDAQSSASIHPMRICEYMRTTLTSLVEALEVDPDKSLHTLDVLPAAERQQILYEWNATDTAFPKDKCVHQLFEQQVDQTPDAVAVVYEDQQLSYRELNLRANQLAHHLRDLGVKPDDRVAICVERSFEMIIGLLAVLKAGGAYVPLDPSYPIDRLNFMLQDTAPVALLTQSHLQLFANTDVSAFPVLDLSAGDLPWKFSPITNPDLHSIGLSPHHLAYVIYTSGSTGLPKGVMVQHLGLTNLIAWHLSSFPLREGQRTSSLASLGFDAATWEIWPSLCAGAVLILARSKLIDLGQFLVWWNNALLSTSFLPTSIAESVLRDKISNPHLNTLLIGGDELRFVPVALTPFALINNYGPTETTVVATSGRIEAGVAGRHIGKPIANTRIYILDVYGEPVPIGVTGELYIGGAGVARGYLNRPELTAEKFLLDPFVMEPGARMYRTGDLGRWLVDGNIEFVGRNDLQVKIRGFRIELGEIETSLSDYDGIRNAVVIVREDATGDKRLVAYYSSVAPGTAIGAEQLRAYLLARLPEYMVPAAYVYLEAMPLTPNGKLDRKALPAPEHDAYATHGYEPPRGDTEQRLAAIWAEVLKLDRIGRHDNFFSLGGHSLSAVQVTSRLRQGFSVEVAVRDLFIHTALADLATFIESATRMDLPSVTRRGMASYVSHLGNFFISATGPEGRHIESFDNGLTWHDIITGEEVS